ncbi:uncharacterized protein N7469_009152 [Penicillium citrinum]|uniref:Uncharacterized protein n=1 Tax=Penicillium citrinum TaxID=5077 RepID=A0A9W9NMY0_PENCI|nr:uncharacterized protein N7469_009152 [Penicillium citrinum]KAJ5222912.1 hypothetical protein N7469_009152 [Penicillium citrinum]
MDVHVVSKLDNNQHATFTLSEAPTPAKLADSSIRVKTQLISLTSNNLSYAAFGDVLKWWDAYPVSPSYPAPYNDPSQWGIVPAWGFASIEESNIPELTPGTLLHGFWPTSSAPTDLKLQASEPSGNWVEISEHRLQLMGFYNRYTVIKTSLPVSAILGSRNVSSHQDELDRLGWLAHFQAIWLAGYFLARYVFPSHKEQRPIHPFGDVAGVPWTKEDADLSSAVVVSLSAAGKTARSFAYSFERRSKENAPLGFLQVTSAVEGLSQATQSAAPPFPSKTIGYGDLSDEELIQWIKDLGPSKFVILDFGARDGALQRLLETVKVKASLEASTIVIVQIGSQQKARSKSDILTSMQELKTLAKIQYNTAGVVDSVIASQGAEALHTDLANALEDFMSERHLSMPDLNLVWKDGVVGGDGIEGGWDLVCNGRIGANEAYVYRVQRA